MSKTDTKGTGTKSKTAEQHNEERRAAKARQQANRRGSTKKSTTQVPFSVGRKQDKAAERAQEARVKHAFRALETKVYRDLINGSPAELIATKAISLFPYIECGKNESRTSAAINEAIAVLGLDPMAKAVQYGERRTRLALRIAAHSDN